MCFFAWHTCLLAHVHVALGTNACCASIGVRVMRSHRCTHLNRYRDFVGPSRWMDPRQIQRISKFGHHQEVAGVWLLHPTMRSEREVALLRSKGKAKA